MSDRFKFRVWFNNQFWYSDNVFHFQNQHETNIVDLLNSGFSISDLDQCTGLKDKNGSLIFEGDIVGFTDKVEWYRGEYFAKVAFGQMTKKEVLDCINKRPMEMRVVELPDDYEWLLSSEIQQYWEVIGNIYETPELLEQ